MKTLVTGATGFIGGHLVRALRADDVAVRALVRPTSDVSHLEGLSVEIFRGDLTDPASLRGCCEGVDAVLHTACAVAGTFDSAQDAVKRFLAVNCDGTLNLAREVLRHGDLRLVHLSSTAAMGRPATERVDETSPCHPKTPYQVSKREAELALLDLHRRRGLNVVILRPCVVAGEGKRNGELLTLFKLVRRGRFPMIGRSGEAEKPLIMVDDVVAAMRLAVHKGVAGEVYLIHSGGGHTLAEIIAAAGRVVGAQRTHRRVPLTLARVVAHAMGAAQRLRPSWNPPLTPERLALFMANRPIDISKARRELGFVPSHQALDEMLGRTYRWYKEQNAL